MPRFFTSNISEDTALIEGPDARHIGKSLRMATGDPLTVSDLLGYDYDCRITLISDGHVALDVLSKRPCEAEPRVKLRLFQALPKSDKLEWIVQKATELGASEIIPVITSRCISRPDEKSMAKKIERLEKIALEAAKQSSRGIVPGILPLVAYEKAVSDMLASDAAILFYENAAWPLSGQLDGNIGSISIMVGPEGGFSEDESQYAAAKGVRIASLGKRILRCETAPICAISAILYALGEY